MSEEEKEPTELTEEQYSKLIDDLGDFEEKFLVHLAGSDKFEVISAIDQRGRAFTKEQLTLVKKECLRLGLKVLYKIDLNSSVYILFNPETMKTAFVSEEIH